MAQPRLGLSKDANPEYCMDCFSHKLVALKCPGCGWKFRGHVNNKTSDKIKKSPCLPTRREIWGSLGYADKK
jgi:hypothetical protein